jgi:hypothetical protein
MGYLLYTFQDTHPRRFSAEVHSAFRRSLNQTIGFEGIGPQTKQCIVPPQCMGEAPRRLGRRAFWPQETRQGAKAPTQVRQVPCEQCTN